MIKTSKVKSNDGVSSAGNEISADLDPSLLTTQLVWREISSLKELLQARVTEVEKGIKVAHDDLVRVPTEVEKSVGGLQSLMENKIFYENKLSTLQFGFIEKQFAWLEVLRVEQKRDTATAVDAALKAAKEAVAEQNTSNVLAINKSEAATSKSIDELARLVNTGMGNLNDKISEVKDRFIVHDSTSRGKHDGVKDFRDWVPWVIAIGMALLYVYNQGRN